MDELNSFFKNLNAPRIQIHAPATSGFRPLAKDEYNTFNLEDNKRVKSEEDDTTDYAEEYQQNDEQEGWNEPELNPMEELEALSSMGDLQSQDHLLSETDLVATYNKYTRRRAYNEPDLPIKSMRQKIISSLESNSVVIIEGSTGCGKTTQVPQWILDSCYERRRPCRIAVTQPRRIAAISIAKRVAHERGWEVGSVVGYQVGLDSKVSEDTRLQYMTTGILLQKLVSSKNMNMYTHIILDEIHERGQEMDFLLLVVKKFLRKNSRGVKVVLMSATFDSAKFLKYFEVGNTPGLLGTDYINIDAKTPFPNLIYHLDALNKFNNLPDVKIDEPCVKPEGYELVVRLLDRFDMIDEEENEHENNAVPPSVLVFLPGINEIEEMANRLEDSAYHKHVLGPNPRKLKWHVVPLHSTVTSQEQARAFLPPPPGTRKVILATNIAESSITVPDIKYVIDFCLMKVLVSDPDTHFTSLQTQWASWDNCTQRAGRAGRVRAGRVYRLVPKAMYKTQFPRSCTPEMERCPLERLVLLAKLLDMGPPKQILALAMNPPKLGNIRTTVLVLKEVGGLLNTLNGEMSYEDGDITYLGRVMAKLPVDIRVSKLIILGHVFGILSPAIVMGAAMTVKNVFNTPFRQKLEAYNSKLTWADGSRSDCIAFYNLYKVWSSKVRQGQITRQNERAWARDMFAQVRALKELDDMVRELSCRLSRLGIAATNTRPAWSLNEMPLVFKVLITGAFYPHYFVQPAGDECREREAFKTLGGLDPCTTVYLKDFPPDQPGELYVGAIKNAFKKLITDEPQVTFCTNSNKVYLTFDGTSEMNENRKTCQMPGRVALPVYKAVKSRQLNEQIVIPCLPPRMAQKFVEELKKMKKPSLGLRLPAITDTFIKIYISHTVDPGHFWVHNDTDINELRALERLLNKTQLLCITRTPQPGDLLVAPYEDQGRVTHCRALVRQLAPNDMAWVLYIDYGNYAKLKHSCLRELPPSLALAAKPLAVECTLTSIGPAISKGDTMWSDDAKYKFNELTHGQELLGKIFSVSHGVISLELLTNNMMVSVNQKLLELGYARRTEESYDSKMNHDLRERAQDMSEELNPRQVQASTQQQEQNAQLMYTSSPLLPAKDCCDVIRLKSAYSPLESSLQNVMMSGSSKSVQIEWNSVNSVLLDTEPQEPYQRLVVAAQVGQNTEGSKLTLRHTTMMPNIPGLPAVMAMLFAPRVELRRDERRTRYVSALCGLGAHRSQEGLRPIFPEHDLLFHFDVEITDDDLHVINHLRHVMNQMLQCAAGQEEPAVPPELADRVPGLARADLITLLTRRRVHRELHPTPQETRWGRATVAPPSAPPERHAALYPPHDALPLQPEDPDHIRRTLHLDAQLKDLIKRNMTSHYRKEEICSICGVGPFDLVSLRIHLYSSIHTERVQQLKAKINVT